MLDPVNRATLRDLAKDIVGIVDSGYYGRGQVLDHVRARVGAFLTTYCRGCQKKMEAVSKKNLHAAEMRTCPHGCAECAHIEIALANGEPVEL